MFRKETVFILGAGASAPYGYPLGKDLIEEMIKNIEQDEIYVSFKWPFKIENVSTPKLTKTSPDKKKIYNFWEIIGFLRSIDEKTFQTDLEQSPTLSTSSENRYDGDFITIKINQILEFRNLKEKLKQFRPLSIDAFLDKHKDLAQAGKIIIVYSLLKLEDPYKFENLHWSSTQPIDPWYAHFLHELYDECEKPEQVLENQVNIITFNYDASLDFYIRKKLKSMKYFDEHLLCFFKKFKIFHVYGCLHQEDELERDYGAYGQTTRDKIAQNSKRFLSAIARHENIKTIGEERSESNNFLQTIKKAEEVVIIGFGFDRKNLSILGFPTEIKKYEIFGNKAIKYLDYKGEMNNLHSQFQEIGALHQITIIRSPATTITAAYQNDFKIRLY